MPYLFPEVHARPPFFNWISQHGVELNGRKLKQALLEARDTLGAVGNNGCMLQEHQRVRQNSQEYVCNGVRWQYLA